MKMVTGLRLPRTEHGQKKYRGGLVMRTEADIELEQFISDQLDGGNRCALRGRSPVFQVRTHSFADGSQQTVIHHQGIRKIHPAVDLAELETISKSELPTRIVRGEVCPVNMANYKRKQRKKITQEYHVKLLEQLVAVAVDGGYESADGVIQDGRLIVYPAGLPITENI